MRGQSPPCRGRTLAIMWHVMENAQRQFEAMNALFQCLSYESDAQVLERVLSSFFETGGDLNRGHGLLLPLQFAAYWANNAALRLFLKNGAKPDAVDETEHQTALHFAAAADYQCTRQLLAAGAAIDAADKNGRTPLHRAVARGKTRNVRLLLQHGADVDFADKHGNAPAHIAGRRGHPDVMKLLLDHNPNLTILNSRSMSPLDVCKRGCLNNHSQLPPFATPRQEQEKLEHRLLCWRLLYRATPVYALVSSRCSSRTNSRNGSRSNSRRGSVTSIHPRGSSCGTSPRTLQDFCRFVVRATFSRGALLPLKLESLAIPHKIRDFLLLRS